MKSFAKKYPAKTAEELLNAFIDDENYYLKQNNPHFQWIIDEFENDEFVDELKKYIRECQKQLKQKEAMKPYLEKQKERAKLQRKKERELALSKAAPTQKQLYYYEKLCKKYNIEKIDTRELSRLDLMIMIGKISDEGDPLKTAESL
jgi:hypothetical protein